MYGIAYHSWDYDEQNNTGENNAMKECGKQVMCEVAAGITQHTVL
jgi:hypothetical protein